MPHEFLLDSNLVHPSRPGEHDTCAGRCASPAPAPVKPSFLKCGPEDLLLDGACVVAPSIDRGREDKPGISFPLSK